MGSHPPLWSRTLFEGSVAAFSSNWARYTSSALSAADRLSVWDWLEGSESMLCPDDERVLVSLQEDQSGLLVIVGSFVVSSESNAVSGRAPVECSTRAGGKQHSLATSHPGGWYGGGPVSGEPWGVKVVRLWMMTGSGDGSGASSSSLVASRSPGFLEGLWSGEMVSGLWEMMWRLRPAPAESGFPLEGWSGPSNTGSSWPRGLRGSSSGFPAQMTRYLFVKSVSHCCLVDC